MFDLLERQLSLLRESCMWHFISYPSCVSRIVLQLKTILLSLLYLFDTYCAGTAFLSRLHH